MWRSEKLEPARELLNRILRRRLYKLIGESRVEAVLWIRDFYHGSDFFQSRIQIFPSRIPILHQRI
jgi:hypothetical protein